MPLTGKVSLTTLRVYVLAASIEQSQHSSVTTVKRQEPSDVSRAGSHEWGSDRNAKSSSGRSFAVE